MDILYTVTENQCAVFAQRQDAEHVAAIHHALRTATTWDEFKRLMPAEALAELIENQELDDEDTADDQPFDADEDVAGYADGDYPEWLQASMLDWFPEELATRFGTEEATALDGDYLEIPGERAEEVAAALREAGHTVERSDLYFL